MRVSIDFEFLEDGRTIDPISVGMVAEDGREYYAVFREMSFGAIQNHQWVLDNVMPSLPVRVGHSDPWNREHQDFKHVKSCDEIRRDVLHFLINTPKLSLWAWFSAYDHVALAQLWGPMVELPISIPQRTNDIAQEWERLGYPLLPEQPSGHHNALEDARFNLVRLAWLDQVVRTGKA